VAKSYAEINGKNEGSNGSKSKLAQRISQATRGEEPDWGRIDSDLIWRLIQRCTVDDGAVMFGYSRDGGAYSLKVYTGGEPEKIYAHSDQELINTIAFILEE